MCRGYTEMHSRVIIFIVRSCKETMVMIWQTLSHRQKSCTSVNASNPHTDTHWKSFEWAQAVLCKSQLEQFHTLSAERKGLWECPVFKQLLFRPIKTQRFIVAACDILVNPSVVNTVVCLDKDLNTKMSQVMIFKPQSIYAVFPDVMS